MSVVISGALIDGAGIPMSGCHIILKSRVNTSEVVMRTVADVVTGSCGEYCFKAQTGKYCVYLKQDWCDEYCVGDISVYDDSKPGTLNDFLTALDEGDLKPDVVKRFEEMVQQAQQSAEKAGEHADAAEQARQDTETLAGEIQQDAEEIAGNVQKAEKLASETNQNAARAEQAVKDADKIVRKAVDKLGEAATLTGEAKACAKAAAKSKQEAKRYRDEAQQIVDGLNTSNATTTEKGLVQLCSDTDNDSEELAATPKAVKTVMDETKTKAPLDSPNLDGTPTTPTPPLDARGCEIANAEFVRALIAATPSGSYSTDSVIPLIINRAQLKSVHQCSEPLVINKVQIQHVHQTRFNEPLIINRVQLKSVHQCSEPLVINKVQIQRVHQTRFNEPLVVKRMGLSFALVTPALIPQ